METLFKGKNRARIGAAVAGVALTSTLLTSCGGDTANTCTLTEEMAVEPAAAMAFSDATIKTYKNRIKEETGAALGIDQIRNGKLASVVCNKTFTYEDLSSVPVVTVTDVPTDLIQYSVVIAAMPSDVESGASEYNNLAVLMPAI